MNENKAEGAAKVALGRFERAAGEAFGDDEMQVRGGVRQAGGYVQEAAGTVQEALGQVAGKARAAASTASEAYSRVSGAALDLGQRIEEEPYVAVGVAAAIGLLVGLLLASRGPKIVYVKPRV